MHIKNIDYKISEEIIKINSGPFFSDPDVERHIASSMVLDLLSSMQPPVGKNHVFKKIGLVYTKYWLFIEFRINFALGRIYPFKKQPVTDCL